MKSMHTQFEYILWLKTVNITSMPAYQRGSCFVKTQLIKIHQYMILKKFSCSIISCSVNGFN